MTSVRGTFKPPRMLCGRVSLLFSAVAVLVIAVAGVAAGDASPSETVSAVAEKTARPAGAPRRSDVCLSSRWRHPTNVKDPHDTFRDARAFHATRLDWVYSQDPAWIGECKRRGLHFGGALNTILTDAPGVATRDKGRILDKNGQRVTAPWMKSWNAWWGCVNSPEYRETYLAHAKLIIDGGADVIHMDNPGINATAVAWGGCYCEHCRKKAEQKGLTLPGDMKALQTDSVREFYAFVRQEIDRRAGRRVVFSSNNYNGAAGFPYDLFDFGIAELPERSATPVLLHGKFSEAARGGRPQVFTLGSTNVALSRRVIATAYACGGHIIVPYDVYHGKGPRIFGTPEQYADLYGFVRAAAGWLDGYEDAAVAGTGLRETRFGEALPVEINAENVFTFVRARPGEPDTPVVIHLVDWRDAPQPFDLKLRTDRFFGGKPIEVKLLVPPVFDADAHAKAEETADFSPLSVEQKLQTSVADGDTVVSLPRLTPWGIAVVSPK